MVHSTRTRARPGRIAAALIMVLFALGMAGPSYADNDNGSSSSSSADNGNGGNSDAGGENGNGGGNGSDNGNAEWKQADETTSPSAEATSAATPETGGSSGDANEANVPQPESNADKNEGGANGQCPGGPYCSTDGEESKNGNGNGKAIGKPCAGCVGKADNKNPQGQKPDWANDGNNGYECDGNNGIGKTNPAHTGCEAAVPPPVTPTTPPPTTPPTTPPTPPPTAPPTPPAPPTPTVPPEQPPTVAPPEVAPTEGVVPRPPAVVPPEVAPTEGVLPPTGLGGFEELLGLIGAGALLLGSAVLLRRRLKA